MVINAVATREMFTRSGRTVAAWARTKGFPTSTVNELVNGIYPIAGKAAQRIITALEADGLIVWMEEQEAA